MDYLLVGSDFESGFKKPASHDEDHVCVFQHLRTKIDLRVCDADIQGVSRGEDALCLWRRHYRRL